MTGVQTCALPIYDTLVWESLEGIKVKPFYHNDESEVKYTIDTKASEFQIVQNIYVHDVALSNKRALVSIVYFTSDSSL